MKFKNIGFIILLFTLLGFSSLAQPIQLNTDVVINPGKNFEILEDTNGGLRYQDVLNSNFVSSDQNVPNLMVSNSVFWIKVPVKNNTKFEDFVLELSYPILDTVKFFYERNGQLNSISLFESSSDSRKYDHQNYLFDLNLKEGESNVFYLRISGGEEILLPIAIGRKHTILSNNGRFDMVSGFYFGIILVMFFYNLFLFWSTKDRGYLLYVIYIFLVGLTQASLKGYTSYYLLPESSWIGIRSVYFSGALVGIAALEFSRYFLQIKEYLPRINKVFFALYFLYCTAMILASIGQFNNSYNIINVCAMIGSLTIFISAIIRVRKGSITAKYFIVAWSVFLTSVILFVLRNFNIIPYNNFTVYVLEIGSALEAVLLSFALADRINILKKEKEESQAQALEALQENERIIKEQNTMLESEVRIRTAELEQSNEELNVILENLKSTQSQLVDAEKMASLGQLTAGIAHEINNPINFVTSNVSPLKKDIDDLVLILNKYGEIKEEGISIEKIQEIEKLKKDLDVDFLIEEMDMLLKGIDEGASRTAEIIKGLRNFSRLDESELKKANINEGIDSTLVVLNSVLGEEQVTVNKDFGDLPEIECYLGKLNQLVMNIINNGIQATISNPNEGKERILEITTKVDGDDILISISDNGKGMDESTRSKIFDPFFTTKDVGEGTGLGLSIAFSIIESHNGQINVDSKVGEGTTFNIRIPKLRKS